MALEAYKKMRDFSVTPEPAGKRVPRPRASAPTSGLFVVQKHAATRLHYDFRLELDGVLLSWAVPKGPSLDPAVKRLAMQVEDHPLEYGGFEGIIPQGEYGGGTVLLWDRGRWFPLGDAREGHAQGRLKFRLEGEKLQGAWHLVRTRGGNEAKATWLLVKERDEAARPGSDVTAERPESVDSGKDIAQIAAQPERVWASQAADGAAMPRFVPPELAVLADTPPAGDDWLHEVKFDGYRALFRIEAGKVRVFTRTGQDWTQKFGALAQAARALPCREALLDGEVVALQPDGRSDFQLLANRLGRDTPTGRKRGPGTDAGGLHAYLFDLLWLDGQDLRERPLVERKAALARLLDGHVGLLRYSDHVLGKGPGFFEQACRAGLEGSIAKRASAPYRSIRSRAWLKLKCLQRQEFVVVGFTAPQGSRRGFGALLLGVHRHGALRFAGRVGTGFTEASLRDLHGRLRQLETDAAPVVDPPVGSAARGLTWVRPELVAEVAFAEWTTDGRLRHPTFQGLRADKLPADVVDERERKAPVMVEPPPRQAQPQDEARGLLADLRLTHPERLLWTQPAVTKRDLADYLARAMDRLLPHVVDRPLMLLRCPQGADHACFFQKHHTTTLPAAVKAIEVQQKRDKGLYLYLDGAQGLLAVAQMAALELHPWGARIDRLDRPDRLVFDLDPDEGLPWARLREAAQLVRALLGHFDLQAFVKTTGGKGLHVVVPVQRRLGWDETKEFCELVAEAVVRAAPDRYTARAAKDKRTGRVFVDWLRNAQGATAVAPWSPRARTGATVAVPLGWDELDGLDALPHWALPDVGGRLQMPDPWADFFRVKQAIARTALRDLRAA